MNYRLQLSPLSSTRQSLSPLVKGWGSSSDAKFFRSWLVYDSDLEFTRTSGRVNWNMVMGLALAAMVSVGFWAAAGWVISYFAK